MFANIFLNHSAVRLEVKGISKWFETAIRPVPERSHMLKTWLTKAGPPLLLLEVSPVILTIDGKPEFDLTEDIPLVADLEEMESG